MRKSKMVQQKDTEWSILETTTSCVIGSDKEEKEIIKNRANHERRQTR